MRNHCNEVFFGGAGLLLGMGGLLGADWSNSPMSASEAQQEIAALRAKVDDLEERMRRQETISRVLLRDTEYGSPACVKPYWVDREGIRRVRAGCGSANAAPIVAPATGSLGVQPPATPLPRD